MTMPRRLLTAAILITVAGIAAMAASKANQSPAPSRPAAKGASSVEAKVSASKAGDIARKSTKGGKLVGIKLRKNKDKDEGKDKPVYEARIRAKDNHLKLVKLDATTGKVMQVEDEGVVLGSWTFDDVRAGSLPDNWVIKQNNPTKALANWAVVAFAGAPTPPRVLSVRSENDTATYNLALVTGTSFKDVDIRVQIRANAGQIDQGGGIIWRAKDENNYYVCRINPLEPNYRVYKVENGKRHQLQTAEVNTETGMWHGVRVVMVDELITCYLDDRKLFEVKDNTLNDAGMVGLWTKADASSSFDDLLVLQAGRPGPPTAPAE